MYTKYFRNRLSGKYAVAYSPNQAEDLLADGWYVVSIEEYMSAGKSDLAPEASAPEAGFQVGQRVRIVLSIESDLGIVDYITAIDEDGLLCVGDEDAPYPKGCWHQATDLVLEPPLAPEAGDVVSAIRKRSEATHLDYPHSRAVSDVEIMLREYDALATRLRECEAALAQIVAGAAGNAGLCMNCNSILQVAYAALANIERAAQGGGE